MGNPNQEIQYTKVCVHFHVSNFLQISPNFMQCVILIWTLKRTLSPLYDIRMIIAMDPFGKVGIGIALTSIIIVDRSLLASHTSLLPFFSKR